MLKETTGVFDRALTHAWQAYTDYESDMLTTAPRFCYQGHLKGINISYLIIFKKCLPQSTVCNQVGILKIICELVQLCVMITYWTFNAVKVDAFFEPPEIIFLVGTAYLALYIITHANRQSLQTSFCYLWQWHANIFKSLING